MITLAEPLTPEEVMGFIKEAQGAHQIWGIFERMGAYGLPNKAELAAIEVFRDDYIEQHELQSKSINAFFGAYALIRKALSGAVSSVDSDAAWTYLRKDAERNVLKEGGFHGYKPVWPSLEEGMQFTNEVLLTQSWVKALQEDLYNLPLNDPISGENFSCFWDFYREYRKKHTLENRDHFWASAKDTLGRLRKGEIPCLSSRDAWEKFDFRVHTSFIK